MSDPVTLTASAIAALAFQKFIESGAGELAKKFSERAISQMDELRQKIWDKLRGHSKAEKALTAVEKGSEADLERLSVYLQDVMEDEPDFAAELQVMAQEINAGKLQDNSSMKQINYGGTNFQNKAEGTEIYQGNITINKT